ncbi:hypothetical protein GQ54DRAFT_263482 [Martensiomyces pterosporus]|nr:hypothetical protein GQ54DRAFT_263482 [Martensiomyces pterosporus]
MGAVDTKLSAELAGSGQSLPDEQAAALAAKPGADGIEPRSDQGAHDRSSDLEALRASHKSELSVLKAQLSELERRKNSEIKKLSEEVESLEDLVEDKIFGESELNDKIAALSDEVDRLQRELQRARAGGGGEAASGHSSKLHGNDGSGGNNGSGSGSGNVYASAGGADLSDDEPAYCSICDEHGHGILDCPSVTSPSSLFKQDAAIDSSRPYCDNCESFGGHWTDECPHGDEMF